MLVSFILAFLGILGIMPKIISIVLWLSVLTYLLIGWKLLASKNEEKKLISFFITYLIAQTLVTLIFGINDYPMKDIFSCVTGTILIVTLILLIINKKNLSVSYPNNRFLIRIAICAMFSFMPLWTNIIH
jgi:hypothetical protein